MSFKITIIGNDNGDVIFEEENAKAIIGGVTTDERTGCIVHTAGNRNHILNAVNGAEEAKKELFKADPLLGVLYALGKLVPDED